MYCILPFEKSFYKKHHFDAHFVGHPLIDAIVNSTSIGEFRKVNQLGEKPIIALLPGSRKQEIAKMLVIMTKVRSNFTDYQFVIAGAPSQEVTYYRKLVGKEVPVVQNQTYELLRNSTAALVTSGTATLETALFNVPEVVCYKANWISYQIAKLLVKVDYISLVNLIMNKESVRELIQKDFNQKNVITELGSILQDEQKRVEIIQDYKQLESLLGGQGASARTAELIVASFTV
jgi:lipid-A-disaccharide synthase